MNKNEKEDIIFEDEDIQYYNIEIDSGNKPFTLATFNETRTSSIIKNPHEYEIAVSRFSIPALYVPIQNFDSPSPYYVTIAYNNNAYPSGYDFTTGLQQLQYIPRSNDPNASNGIWNYGEFVEIINNALKKSFTDIKLAYPAAPPTEPPYIIYDSSSKLLTLIAQLSYEDERDTGIPTFKVCFDELLYQFFPSWRIFQWKVEQPFPGDLIEYNEILIKDLRNNTTTISGNPYLNMIQEYQTLSLLNEYRSIVITTTMPIVSEMLGTQNDNFRTILTDFLIPPSIDDRETLQYSPQGELKYYDFNTTSELRNIDIQIFYMDQRSILYPIYIPFNKSLTLKLQFRRKSHYSRKKQLHSIDYNLPKEITIDKREKQQENKKIE